MVVVLVGLVETLYEHLDRTQNVLGRQMEIVFRLQESIVQAGNALLKSLFRCNELPSLRVAGAWQKYRMSLVHNNRHNRFHWADMNALDVIPAPVMAGTRWPEPRCMPPDVRRVGLFLGASAAEKRPSASFWAHQTE